MGDIANMMLEGSMCQECGEYLGEGDGYPTFCASCMKNHPEAFDPNRIKDEEPINPKVPCPTCGRRVTQGGLPDHIRAKHGVKP